MELVTETAQLNGCACLVHDLYSAGEDVECLHGLCFDMLVSDEGHGFLCAAEQDVYKLLSFC